MGAIAGAHATSDDPSQIVHELLQRLRHRGTNATVSCLDGAVIVGASSNRDPKSQLSETSDLAVAVNGSFYRRENPAGFAIRALRKATLRGGASRLMSEPGGFAILGTKGRKLIAFRDPNGLKPLYSGKLEMVTAFASERKALWRTGFRDVKRVTPGTLYTISDRRDAESRIARFKRPRERSMTFDQARRVLARALTRSARELTRGLKKIAVAFSGGLDSALAAVLAKAFCEVELVSVGLSDSAELQTAEEYANELGLPLTKETFALDGLESYVRRVVWLIEEPNLMKVGVAVPLHWAATVASKRNHVVMLCGQGSDELYGGYYKYARILDTEGRAALRRQLFRSVVEAAEVNYERDEQATAPSGVELRTPFADLGVIELSMAIPSEFKVRDRNDVTRKWILRAVGRDLRVPDSIVWRRKKAIQHGTGVENAIIKLAKARNLSAHSYLTEIFEDVRQMDTMP